MKKLTIIMYVVIASGLIFFSGCDVLNDDNPEAPQESVGDTLWIHNIPQGENEVFVANIPLAIGKEGDIYYTASGGMANWEPSRIYAINKDDGTLKWTSEPLELWHVNSNIVIGDDGTIYVMSYTKLYSIDPGSGTFNWVWEVPQTLQFEGQSVNSYGEVSSLALANNGDLIFKTSGSGSYYRALYCVGNDGNTKWYRIIAAEINPITIGYDGAIFDYAREDGKYYIFETDPETGNVLWKTSAYTGSGTTNITVADNGDLIAFIANDTLARIDPVNGNILWKTLAQTSSKQIVIDNSGRICAYDQWSGMHRFNSQNGSESGEAISVPNPICVDSDGKMYFAGGNLMDVYNSDGTKAWSFNCDAGSNSNSLTISPENIVYVAGTKKVYAIKGDGALAPSGWPSYTHDNRNTFNSNKH